MSLISSIALGVILLTIPATVNIMDGININITSENNSTFPITFGNVRQGETSDPFLCKIKNESNVPIQLTFTISGPFSLKINDESSTTFISSSIPVGSEWTGNLKLHIPTGAGVGLTNLNIDVTAIKTP